MWTKNEEWLTSANLFEKDYVKFTANCMAVWILIITLSIYLINTYYEWIR